MIRRAYHRKTAREISGHKTDTVFSRYNIVSEVDIRDAAHKIDEGAKAAIQSSFIVEQRGEPATEQETAKKPF
jgi:hypothetical protein